MAFNLLRRSAYTRNRGALLDEDCNKRTPVKGTRLSQVISLPKLMKPKLRRGKVRGMKAEESHGLLSKLSLEQWQVEGEVTSNESLYQDLQTPSRRSSTSTRSRIPASRSPHMKPLRLSDRDHDSLNLTIDPEYYWQGGEAVHHGLNAFHLGCGAVGADRPGRTNTNEQDLHIPAPGLGLLKIGLQDTIEREGLHTVGQTPSMLLVRNPFLAQERKQVLPAAGLESRKSHDDLRNERWEMLLKEQTAIHTNASGLSDGSQRQNIVEHAEFRFEPGSEDEIMERES